MKALIDGSTDKENMYRLLKDKTSLLKELGLDGKKSVSDLKEQLNNLLGQMRFPDGRTLKDRLMERDLERRLKQSSTD